MAFRGEMPDLLPYVPRIDLWYNANSYAGTLPAKHRGKSQDDISRAEGWAMHKQLPDFLDTKGPEDMLHRGVIVRPMSAYGYPTFIRITVGTHSENERLLKALAATLAKIQYG